MSTDSNTSLAPALQEPVSSFGAESAQLTADAYEQSVLDPRNPNLPPPDRTVTLSQFLKDWRGLRKRVYWRGETIRIDGPDEESWRIVRDPYKEAQ